MSKQTTTVNAAKYPVLQTIEATLLSRQHVKVVDLITALKAAAKVNSELTVKVSSHYAMFVEFEVPKTAVEQAKEELAVKRLAIEGIKAKLAYFEQEAERLATIITEVETRENSKVEQ
jgi:ribonucleotide reductase alpha subunit